MLACAHQAFDGPVILFQKIIEVLHRSMPAILLQSLLGFERTSGVGDSSAASLAHATVLK
jgi:hypothetical protein